MPDDAVEISASTYQALLEAQAAGQVIDWSNGMPQAVAPPPLPWSALQTKARRALQRSDVVAMRCVKARVPYPAGWLAYDEALRAIVRAETGDPAIGLPAQPAFPPGT